MEGSAFGLHFGNFEFNKSSNNRSIKEEKIINDIISMIEEEINNTDNNYELGKLLVKIESKYRRGN